MNIREFFRSKPAITPPVPEATQQIDNHTVEDPKHAAHKRVAILFSIEEKIQKNISKRVGIENQIRRGNGDLDAAAKEIESLKVRFNKLNDKAKKAEDDIYKGATFINCPRSQKDIAKKMGAGWCPSQKLWYIPRDLDRQPFLKRWQVVKERCKTSGCNNFTDQCECDDICKYCDGSLMPQLCGWCTMPGP